MWTKLLFTCLAGAAVASGLTRTTTVTGSTITITATQPVALRTTGASVASVASKINLPENCQIVNRTQEALGGAKILKDNGFLIYDEAFLSLLGHTPNLTVIAGDQSIPFAHEAAVFWPDRDALFVTSNLITDKSGKRMIQISRIDSSANGSHEIKQIAPGIPGIPMANGGVNYRNGILFCAQGTKDQSSGLIHMLPYPPYEVKPLLTTFHGRQFNGPNDVVIHSDGSIWFTDPVYGWEQGFRPTPELPNQVYRFDPVTGDVRVMADGFERPNGITFSPDESVAYITDTGAVHGDGSLNKTRPATIYAFSVVWHRDSPFLTNRRVFAYADTGIPDGIKCDVYGNVWSGCGDGVNVWDDGGRLLGKILIPGGVANFGFGRNGEIFLCGEHSLWRAKLRNETRGALLGI